MVFHRRYQGFERNIQRLGGKRQSAVGARSYTVRSRPLAPQLATDAARLRRHWLHGISAEEQDLAKLHLKGRLVELGLKAKQK